MPKSKSKRPVPSKYKMIPTKAPWSKALVLICTKCCAEKGMDLAIRFKEHMKELGTSPDIRVSKSGCLNLCPKNKVVIGLTSQQNPIQLFTVNPKIEMYTLEKKVLDF